MDSTTAAPVSNYYSTNLRDRVLSMLKAGRWMDCKFQVGAQLQEMVEGHKLILSSASPVFEAMFFGAMAESKNPILIPDIQPAAFKAMLEYIYTDDIKLTSLQEAFNLYYAANKYIMPNLEKLCITYIESILDKKNVCQVYEFASMFDEKYLMDKCLDFTVMPNIRADFFNNHLICNLKNVKLSTLVAIFSIETLKQNKTLYFCRVAKLYAEILDKRVESGTNCEADCRSDNHKSSECPMLNNAVMGIGEYNAEDSKETTEESLGQGKGNTPPPSGSKKEPSIRPLLEKIHFLTLTPKEFAQGPAISGLLTESEAYAILMNIVWDGTEIPMPSGFSTYRGQRDK